MDDRVDARAQQLVLRHALELLWAAFLHEKGQGAAFAEQVGIDTVAFLQKLDNRLLLDADTMDAAVSHARHFWDSVAQRLA